MNKLTKFLLTGLISLMLVFSPVIISAKNYKNLPKNIVSSESEKVTYAPLVVKNLTFNYTFEYRVGEWVDENKDGIMTPDEWTCYVADIILPDERKEYRVPAGYYVVFIIAHKGDELYQLTAYGWIPDPKLKSNEKTTLIFTDTSQKTEA